MIESPPIIVVLIVGSLLLACLFAFCHAQITKKRKAARIRKYMEVCPETACKKQEMPFPFNKSSQNYQPQRFLVASEASGFQPSDHNIPMTLKSSQKIINKYEHVLKASTLTRVSHRVYSPETVKDSKRSTTRRPNSSLAKSGPSNFQHNINRGSDTRRPSRSKTATRKPPNYRPSMQQFDNIKRNSTLPECILKPEIPYATMLSMPYKTEMSGRFGNS